MYVENLVVNARSIDSIYSSLFTRSQNESVITNLIYLITSCVLN